MPASPIGWFPLGSTGWKLARRCPARVRCDSCVAPLREPGTNADLNCHGVSTRVRVDVLGLFSPETKEADVRTLYYMILTYRHLANCGAAQPAEYADKDKLIPVVYANMGEGLDKICSLVPAGQDPLAYAGLRLELRHIDPRLVHIVP